MWSTSKTKSSSLHESDRVRYVMKTILDNNMTNRTREVYVENDIKLSWPIRLGVVIDENQIRQQRDQLCRCGLS